MKKKILILSFDAMVGEDIEYLRNKPDSHFNRVMGNCAAVDNMRSVYPSITYPAHFSIASGCNPGTSGFYQNGYLLVGNSGKKGWILESNQFPVEDFFAAAKRAGMTTASVYWPSMANNPNIDYLINEYFFPNPDEKIAEGFACQGASRGALEAVAAAMPYYPKRYHVPGFPTREDTYDDFIIECLCQLIRTRQPDFAVAHHCYIDTMRHKYGVFNNHVRYAVDVVELVQHNIDVFRQNTREGENVTIRQGNAKELSMFADDTYDITLLLGPMYHLYTVEEQKQALREAIRVTRKGGVIFTAYCGNDATMVQYCFGRGMLKLEKYQKLVDMETFKASSDPAELFELYRREDIDALMADLAVTRLHYVGTDMATNYMRSAIDEMDDDFFALYLRYHFTICELADMVGTSHHILDVFRKE